MSGRRPKRTTPTAVAATPGPDGLDALEAVQRRVLWLAVRMVDHANRERPNPDGIKVGGHQASSASMVGIMTALWFAHLRRGDRVAVKPHASPVFHAIQYLLGNLDRSYLTRLREFGGLQAYPSRTKDPDGVDFSTGSVGLGAAAPLFAAATRRYVDAHFGARPENRFVALLGDAELDEGNIWEAVADPATQGLGNVLWVVDLNRQSLDRVVPGIRAQRLQSMFAANGWHVVEAKYGGLLQAAFRRPGGDALRRHVDDMSNEEYQALFAYHGAELRDRFLASADAEVKRVLDTVADEDLGPLLHNLGGHDLGELLQAFAEADNVRDRPSVVFAYTVKGWGLPIAGDPLNHAALLTEGQVDELRAGLGLTADDEWDRFADDSPAGRLCTAVRERLRPEPTTPRTPVAVPVEVGATAGAKPSSTQEAFGRVLQNLGRHEEVARRLVTTSPDVAVSTNLGGWINRMGVFSPEEQADYLGEGRLLRWRQTPTGRHIELGISEMNLFLLLGQLGLAHELSGEQLLPVGTVYDPFVCRGLDAFIYATYTGARFVVVGTPAGITLSPEGGAHQSTITASIGLELPGVTFAEPAYATAVDWLLCDGLRRLGEPDGESLYLRLSTRQLDQAPFEVTRERLGSDELRRQVLAGGYRLVDASGADPDRPVVNLVASGAVLPEVVTAAARLSEEGIAANVIDVTSLDRLHRDWLRSREAARHRAAPAAEDFHLATLIPAADRGAPMVTVHDAASHAMTWIGGVFGAPVVPLGVDRFGQSGSLSDLHRAYDLTADHIATAAVVAVDGMRR